MSEAALLSRESRVPRPASHAGKDPGVIVGSGPVGLRVAHELVAFDGATPVVVFGAEAWAPYNRVKLSSFLGSGRPDPVARDLRLPPPERVELRLGCVVRTLDLARREVTDAAGHVQGYRELVLATGSRPAIPGIPGTSLPGVFTFRDMDDAQRLCARRLRSRRTVVIGGGLLGLEAARAMRRFNTRLVVIEHEERLMPRQLDEVAAQHLLSHVWRSGVTVLLRERVAAILGAGRVESLLLRGGRSLACDTVIIATGIVPSIDLARDAGLRVGRGIQVDDRLRTSDPNVLAVGDCAEHRGKVYGLVAPGFEQAAVAAHGLAGGDARYVGSLAATRLKIVDLPVFSMGAVLRDAPRDARQHVHRDATGYRKLVTVGGRLVGAIAVGEWEPLGRVQEAIAARRALRPWHLLRFRWTGAPWPGAGSGNVSGWPAATVVCNCTGVTRGALAEAVAHGCASVESLAARTSASTVCGSCRPLLDQLCGAAPRAEPGSARWLGGLGLAAVALAALVAVSPPVLWPTTADLPWRWDQLWRDSSYKQASGYTLLALMAVLAFLSLRKRLPRLRLGDFGAWRAVHAAAGVGGLVALIAHTGGKLGHNLNLALALCVLGLALAGGLAGVLSARGARASVSQRGYLDRSLWTHILLLWPLPVLLTVHIVKAYYF